MTSKAEMFEASCNSSAVPMQWTLSHLSLYGTLIQQDWIKDISEAQHCRLEVQNLKCTELYRLRVNQKHSTIWAGCRYWSTSQFLARHIRWTNSGWKQHCLGTPPFKWKEWNSEVCKTDPTFQSRCPASVFYRDWDFRRFRSVILQAKVGKMS